MSATPTKSLEYWKARASAADELLKKARAQVAELKGEVSAIKTSMTILEGSRRQAGVAVETYMKENVSLRQKYKRVRNVAVTAASLMIDAVNAVEKDPK